MAYPRLAVQRLLAIVRHPLIGPLLRYGVAGAVVMLVYLSFPLAVNAIFGVPLEVCIPIAYVLAVSLQFNLQRYFVFRHVDEFALPVHRQVGWYLAIAAVQYPISALSVAILPTLLGVPERVVFVVTTLVVSLVFFLFLRRRVFHAGGA